ncbi:hypothetical protein GX51_08167 [Blastomyces parvus]|uniref:protein S-acyltransferase n=1 Tax=Blastomyces parvus TaxID=2060905 RepID=A0A2B7WGR0_9EURO|nr:hypothetical protein GX51_08167 [Blastomyces parvus]
MTPLSWFAWEGNEAAVKLLLENGANLEPKDKDGRTPMYHAKERGHEGVVKLLLEKGPNLESRDRDARLLIEKDIWRSYQAAEHDEESSNNILEYY